MYRILAREYGWTFAQIADMTLEQQLIALQSDSKTINFGSMQEYRQWATKR
jgi:hypothetical protein